LPVIDKKSTVPKEEKEIIPKKWETEELIPPALRNAIQSKILTPEKKAGVVYRASVTLMERLFEDPNAENIKEAKSGIADVVDFVIKNDKVADSMLKITSHDFYTYTHSVNVGILSVILAKKLLKGSDSHNMIELGAGFFLHDIGKVRVDAAVINKKGKLTNEEFENMKKHTSHGCEILSETNQLSEECRIIVMQHHERYDGTGYPLGLKYDEINIYGKICSIADVYDALTGERSYRKQLRPFEALKLMKEQMINHFQKEIFEKFVLLFSN